MNQDLILQHLKDAVAACRVNPAVQSEENRQILKEFEDLLNDAEYENSRETPLDALDFILSSLGAFSSLLMLANEILRTMTDLEHRYTKSCKPRFKELYNWLDGALDACSDLSGGDEQLQMVQEDFLQSLLTVASTAMNRRTGKKEADRYWNDLKAHSIKCSNLRIRKWICWSLCFSRWLPVIH